MGEIKGYMYQICSVENTARYLKQLQNHSYGTYMHCIRVGAYVLCAGQFIQMDEEKLKNCVTGAVLHDIGKIYVPAFILDTKKNLNSSEREQIKEHPERGYDLIKGQYPKEVESSVLFHHERINGSGYPYGISGDDIPMEARIVAICDMYDAMITKRCYKESFSYEETMCNLYTEAEEYRVDTKVLDALAATHRRAEAVLNRGVAE